MCDSNWYGAGEAKSLIRRGCDKGTAMFVVPYSGGVFKVVFEIYKTYQIYRLYDGNELINKWKQTSLPDDLRDILGWRYDKSSKILLNLCDQELDMPFVNSNERYNFDALRFIIQNEELERSRFNIGEWIRELKGSINDVTLVNENLKGKVGAYSYVDTAKIKDSIEERQEISRKAHSCLVLIKSLNSCVELTKPEVREINTEEVESTINKVKKLYELGITLQSVIKEKVPTCRSIDADSVENIIESCKRLNTLRYTSYQLLQAIDSMNTAKMNYQNAIEHLEDFEEEHKFCPLCGNRIGGE